MVPRAAAGYAQQRKISKDGEMVIILLLNTIYINFACKAKKGLFVGTISKFDPQYITTYLCILLNIHVICSSLVKFCRHQSLNGRRY